MEYSAYIENAEKIIKEYEKESKSLSDRDDSWIEDAENYKKKLVEEFVDKLPQEHIRKSIHKYIKKDITREFRQDITNLLFNYYSFMKFLAGVQCDEKTIKSNRYYCDTAAKDVAEILNKILGHIEYLSGSKNDLKLDALNQAKKQMLEIWERIKKEIEQEAVSDVEEILSYRDEA